MRVYKINLPIFYRVLVTEITWFLLYMTSISYTIEWNCHLLFRINIIITVLLYWRLFYASAYCVIVYKFCVSITAALNQIPDSQKSYLLSQCILDKTKFAEIIWKDYKCGFQCTFNLRNTSYCEHHREWGLK